MNFFSCTVLVLDLQWCAPHLIDVLPQSKFIFFICLLLLSYLLIGLQLLGSLRSSVGILAFSCQPGGLSCLLCLFVRCFPLLFEPLGFKIRRLL